MTAHSARPSAVRTAVALLVGSISTTVAATVVSVGLHDLTVVFAVEVTTIQWVMTAYLLALCVMIPNTAWLQAKLGARRLWLASLAVFLVGSLLCGLAWDAPSLVGFRIVQGLAAGVMTPLLSTILMQTTSTADRARVTSMVALWTAVGPILGPVLGGLVLGFADWRWLFWSNVPLCSLGLYLAWRMLAADEVPRPPARLDIVGLLLLPPALVAMLWGLSSLDRPTGVAHPEVLVPVMIGAVLLVAFTVWGALRGSRALVDLGVLRSRPTWSAATAFFLAGAALHGAMLLLPLFWQEVRMATPLEAGLLLVPQGLGALLSRSVALPMLRAWGARVVAIIGFIVSAIATVPFVYAGDDTPVAMLMTALLVRGMGIGMVVIPLMTVAFDGLAHGEVPHASILIRIGQQVGGSVGVALLAVVLGAGTSRAGAPETGFGLAFALAAGITGAAALVSLAIPGARRGPRAGSRTLRTDQARTTAIDRTLKIS